jgi:uncharacterized protein
MQAARQPSIDELLASIRQAIHDRVGPADVVPADVGPADPGGASPGIRPAPPARPDADSSDRRGSGLPVADKPESSTRESGTPKAGTPESGTSGPRTPDKPMKRTIVTAGQEGFAGLLGGDVRLEEALARLNHGGWRHGAATLSGAESPQETAHGSGGEVVVLPKAALRRTIDDWAGGMASPVAATDQPPTSASPPARPSPPASLNADRPSAAGTRSAPRQAMPATAPAALPGAHQTRAARSRKDELWEDEAMFDEGSCAPPPVGPPDHASASGEPEELLSSEAASVASSAFNRLAEAMVARSAGGERNVDDITREILRPLLKSWLDENLPGLVERLVREEIERVARPKT